MMLNKPKSRYIPPCLAQSGSNSGKSSKPIQGIHLLKNMRADKNKGSSTKGTPTKGVVHCQRAKQPVQQQMQKLPVPEGKKKSLKGASSSKQLPQPQLQKLVVPKQVPQMLVILNPEEEMPGCSEMTDVPATTLTQKMILDYGREIEMNLEAGDSAVNVANCLKNHNVSPYLRARMVNWMVEVLSVFVCEDQTFFTAVALMDSFYANTNKAQNADDVHLTGIVSMFIASKYVDCYPLTMDVVYRKIGYKQFGVETIKAKEREVMRTIKFFTTFPTILNFLEHFTEMLAFSNRAEFTERHLTVHKKMRKLCIFYGKLSQYSYHMLQYSSPLMLAKALIYFVVINEGVAKGEEFDSLFKLWVHELVNNNMRMEEIEACAKELAELKDTFTDKFPDLLSMQLHQTHLLE